MAATGTHGAPRERRKVNRVPDRTRRLILGGDPWRKTTSLPYFPRETEGVGAQPALPVCASHEAALDVDLPEGRPASLAVAGLPGYRSAPLEKGWSLGELLQGRRLRTPLPDVTPIPRVQAKAIRHAEGVFTNTQEVISRLAQVLDQLAARSYQVVTEDNRLLRHNRQRMLKTREPSVRDTADSNNNSGSEDAAEKDNEPLAQCSAVPARTLEPGTVSTSNATTVSTALRQ
ncbi:hypothetical protein HPB49_025107 [Dermacentor silvarum]|uniref:Uncharacterized protein n=1 Tax=Dermacentor silvarum TaxID=543639 RepID=A0ACB8DS57_DERSI|nr:hypothetical protein HPB49_025107 [Dermacentor silvarum]